MEFSRYILTQGIPAAMEAGLLSGPSQKTSVLPIWHPRVVGFVGITVFVR